MNALLADFEHYLVRGPTEASKILGMSYSSYASTKCGARVVPRYIKAHIDTLRRMDAQALNELVRDRLADAKK